MAKGGSSKSSDFLQIVMMTFYMMSLFFGLWGTYNHFFKVKKLQAKRTQEERSLEALTKQLETTDNREAQQNWLRKEESKKKSSPIEDEVNEVYTKLGGAVPKKEQLIPQKQKDAGQGIVEQKASIKFQPGTISSFVTFIYRLENDKPHINFTRIRLNPAGRKKQADVDSWDGDMDLVSYTSQKK